jgi:hypothetical protein
MHGGQVLSEQYVQNVSGDIVMDPLTGKPLVNRTYSTPDGRLAMQYLGRSRPGDWGNNGTAEIKVTGTGEGGAVKVVHEVEHIVTLAERLSQVAAMKRGPSGLDDEDDDIHDAEIVEDGEGV